MITTEADMSGRPMRTVVIGSNGRLGCELLAAFRDHGEVIGLARADMDLSDPESINRVLGGLEYDRVLISAALTAVDYCESNSDEAYAVNAEAPRIIAEISKKKGAHVTYVSTDFVFDGTQTGPYSEYDQANPISVYGASKLRGEEHVMNTDRANLVVRVSWVFGPGRPAFPEWIIGQALEKSDLFLPGDKIASPSSSRDLARMIKLLVTGREGEPASDIFHLCNTGICTWRDWGQFCLEEAIEAGVPLKAREIKPNLVSDVAAFIAKRPLNSALATSKYEAWTGVKPPSWQESLSSHLYKSPLLNESRELACG
ncbi:dTDP-4-dehydrorhamnose reductase [Haloferula sp.]|uniref:dTDP-4-dehydrorhamnose reductase n=1 Tax=Haloferula sp. TaxID=2497595 RepID=UPI0032A03396